MISSPHLEYCDICKEYMIPGHYCTAKLANSELAQETGELAAYFAARFTRSGNPVADTAQELQNAVMKLIIQSRLPQ